jgi:hypothetical protein
MPASMRLRATEQRPPPWAVFLFPAKEEEMEYKKPIPTERLIFQEGRYVKCIYFSLVIKMEALENKYPGGTKGFSERYIFKCNRDIAVNHDHTWEYKIMAEKIISLEDRIKQVTSAPARTSAERDMSDAIGWLKWSVDRINVMASINPDEVDSIAHGELIQEFMKSEAERLMKIREAFVKSLEQTQREVDHG